MNLRQVGISAAASWAWGTSLIIGMEIARDKGMPVFIMWAIVNTLTLLLFGMYYNKIKQAKNVKVFKGFMLIIQVMCLIINLNIINSLVHNMWITSFIGLIFVLSVYRRGIFTSIATDQWQYLIMVVGVIAICIFGEFGSYDWTYHAGETSWLMFSSTVLLLSPICDLQHYQRAEIGTHAYTWGALYFGGYIALVGIASAVQITPVITIIMIIAMLMATSSTIDSITSSLHEIMGKKNGTILALFLCFAWSVFVELGVLELWNNFGYVRISLAVILLIYVFKNRGINKNENN